MHAAVVGHVEWIEFVRVEHVPMPGEIIHALARWEEPGGGGSVAAVQLAKLAGTATFFTVFGNDDLGRRARSELTERGVRVEAIVRPTAQRRATTFVDAKGERTIIVLGDRLGPGPDDPLPWDELEAIDAVYVCAADPAVIRLTRRARVVVATSRILADLQASGIELDALVGSALDPSERYAHGDLDPPPALVVRTEGAAGGTFQIRGEQPRRYVSSPVPGPIADTYGAGDSFAAGLTWALGEGRSPEDAIAFAARCGAAVLSGRGPYEGQLRA